MAENSVYVASAARGRGVGTALMEALVACGGGGRDLDDPDERLSRRTPPASPSTSGRGSAIVGRRERIAELGGVWRDTLFLELRLPRRATPLDLYSDDISCRGIVGNAVTPVILGLLAIAPRSGYEIKAVVDRSTRFFWAASYSQIYPELRRLEQDGLIAGEDEPSGGRARRVYEPDRRRARRARGVARG